MAEPICVQRDGRGKWRVTRGAGGDKVTVEDTRGDAIQAALDARETEAVVLLRDDGTVHGELHHATGATGGQAVSGGTATDGGKT